MHDLTRHANVMTATERDDLIPDGWPVEVIDSLRQRGFRPCKPDIVSARFEGDARDCIGFLRQTTLPHIQITLERSQDVTSLMEAIDSEIRHDGRKMGMDEATGPFVQFLSLCKNRRPPPDLSALEQRLQKVEAAVNTMDEGRRTSVSETTGSTL